MRLRSHMCWLLGGFVSIAVGMWTKIWVNQCIVSYLCKRQRWRQKICRFNIVYEKKARAGKIYTCQKSGIIIFEFIDRLQYDVNRPSLRAV